MVELLRLGHIAIQNTGRLQLGTQFFHRRSLPLALIGKDQRGPLADERSRYGIGDAPFISDAENECGLAGEQFWHRSVIVT